MRGTLLPATVAFAVAVFAQVRVERLTGPHRSQREVLYLWSGDHVRRASLGFQDLMADVYWLRTVQYFGGQRAYAGGKDFTLLQPLVDITTTLDPRLDIAYRYGATFLAEESPVGAGQPRAAIALLEKGVRHNPGAWRLRQDLGLFHYFFLRDHVTASRVLMEAARVPGAPQWLEALAARILTAGGDRATARQVWQSIYQQAEEGQMKTNALLHLQRLDALDRADIVHADAERFRLLGGRWPSSLEELRASGLLRAEAVDPAGVALVYDATSGKVEVARSSPLWRLRD